MQVEMGIHLYTRKDQWRYNKPTANKIAVVLKSVAGKPLADRDYFDHLYISENGNTFRRISTRQSICVHGTYPLLPPIGDQRRNFNLQLRKKDGTCEKLDNVQDDPGYEKGIEYDDESCPKKRVGEKEKDYPMPIL